MKLIAEWWFRPAAWWQFWRPQSGAPGAAIVMATTLVALALCSVFR